MEFRKCFVPSCNNNSDNSPDKIFVKIREDLREKWCKAANTDYFRVYTYYCCEDHFDPAKDLKPFRDRKKNVMLLPTAKFRYMSKTDKPDISPENTTPATTLEEPSEEPKWKQPELKVTILEEQPLLAVRKTKKRILRNTRASVTKPAKKPAKSMGDFSKACRCCLLEVGPMKPIFGSSLDVMLMDLTGFQIKRNDGYPQQICIRCIRKLSSAHNFYQTIHKSHKTVEEKCKVAKLTNNRKSSVDFAIKEVEDEEINTETKAKTTSVSCQTEEMFFQKLMLANVQLSRIEREGSYEMEMEDSTEYAMSDNEEQIHEEELPEKKYAVRGLKVEPETYGYKCPQCLHVANNEADLKEHVQTHLYGPARRAAETEAAAAAEAEAQAEAQAEAEVETPAQLCNICGQTFKCRTSLYKHLRFHSGLVFECKYCDKHFAEKSTLKVHMIRHSLTNAKPFDCPACDRTFAQKAALNKHTRTMHSAQRSMYQCQQCDRSFLYKYSLQKHCLKHHTITQCNLCDSQFSGMLELEQHVKNHKDSHSKPKMKIEAEYLEFDEL